MSCFLGKRPSPTLLFFILLGLTNLAKGPLVGAAPIIVVICVYLVWNGDLGRIRHYTWLWGLVVFLALTVAWPYWAQRRYPDIWDNWAFDYLGRSGGAAAPAAHQWDQPWWYYPEMLMLALAPWTWATLIGLISTAGRAWRVPRSPERFLWTWAMVSLIVLSLPARKHHHYLVPVIAPWAILSALGLVAVEAWFKQGRGFRPCVPRLGFAAIVIGFAGIAAWVQITIAGQDPATLAEMAFLRQIPALVPSTESVWINADVDSLAFFRLQFTLRCPQRLLHNLSFLRDRDITAPAVYLITLRQRRAQAAATR